MKTPWFFSVPAAAVLSCLLSGCLVSKTSLITAANSDRPFPPHGIMRPADGSSESASVDLQDDNSYVVKSIPAGDGKGDAVDEKLYFKKISDNIYIYSRPEIDRDTGTVQRYVYGYMKIIDGTRIAIHEPDCSDFDPADMKKRGVNISRTGSDDDFKFLSCHIPSAEVLETVLRNYLNDPRNAEKIKDDETKGALVITAR
jgi:hypothetical protein